MNKKGSAIVESTMIFPVVIICMIAMIYMMVYFYGQLEHSVDMHIMLRAESGNVCDNMKYAGSSSDFPVYKKAQQLYSYDTVSVDSYRIMSGRSKKIAARKYMIDETKIVRAASTVKDTVSDNE